MLPSDTAASPQSRCGMLAARTSCGQGFNAKSTLSPKRGNVAGSPASIFFPDPLPSQPGFFLVDSGMLFVLVECHLLVGGFSSGTNFQEGGAIPRGCFLFGFVECPGFLNIFFWLCVRGGGCYPFRGRSERPWVRPLWRHYFQNTNGVIFVVDSNDKERVGQSRCGGRGLQDILFVTNKKGKQKRFKATKSDNGVFFQSITSKYRGEVSAASALLTQIKVFFCK